MFAFLRSVDLRPLEWEEAVLMTGTAAPHISEILDAAFGRAQAVVVLLTGDDQARLREPLQQSGDAPHETDLTPRARPNVLFEAGMALSSHPDRTVLVQIGDLRPFCDIGGRHVVVLDNSSPRRQALVQRLQGAGCPTNISETDWHSVGIFRRCAVSAPLDVRSRPSMSPDAREPPQTTEVERQGVWLG
jgi:hypothetical protein